jgi:uncharacterized cupredoxin-like copper-binding protein
MRRTTLASIGAAAVLGLGLAGCGSDGGGDKAAAGDVHATLSDFKIVLDHGSVRGGKVTFDVGNDGPSQHEFVVFKTDLAADKLPTKADGDVDEEGAKVEHIDEIEDIGKGDTPSLSVDLDAGHYVAVCNLPAHYRQGMRVEFSVT